MVPYLASTMPTYQFPTNSADKTVAADLPPLINQLLINRGIESEAVAQAFLEPNYDTQLHDPLLLHDIDTACERIVAAMAAKETIAIFSDYDCDGIPGGVVLYDLFTALEYKEFINYIPHRHFEGFGLSNTAIDRLKEQGVTLIITIDCGTTNVAEVAYAAKQGIDVIITDHHEPGEGLPQAVAVVNPKLGDYPFKDLCGAAVAFKLAQALLQKTEHQLLPGKEKWWLDMVGIATIADMVPLTGENRVLAHYGLQVLRKSRRPGLQQLLKKAKVNQSYLNEEDVGFTIGPRINAASRMETPEDAFYMLAETDLVAASDRVEHLEKLNQERKTQVAQMTKDLHTRVRALEELPPVLVMGHATWRPSLVGLAATKLAEEHSRPVFLWGVDGNGVYKGSCRSAGGISVVTLMQAASDAFTEHGGHHYSGGFSVKDDYIFTLGETLVSAYEKLGNEAAIAEEVVIDAEIGLNEVTPLLIQQLRQLAPFGAGNPKPIFAFNEVVPLTVDLFGKTKEHTKLTFDTESGTLEAIAFFRTPIQFTKEPKAAVASTLIAHIEQSFFMGRLQNRLRIIDIV